MKYYDSLETRDPDERERSLLDRLPRVTCNFVEAAL